jgi:hypothetical protein
MGTVEQPAPPRPDCGHTGAAQAGMRTFHESTCTPYSKGRAGPKRLPYAGRANLYATLSVRRPAPGSLRPAGAVSWICGVVVHLLASCRRTAAGA